MGYMLETRGLTKRFGRGDQAQDAVADVSLHIRESEVYGLLGPNGAGKSTTLKMICGMLRPTAGEILFAGHAWRREDLYAIGSLIEEAPLYPNLTARENLRVRTTLLGLPESRVDEVLRKPFGAAELRAKVAAHLRRERRPRSHALSFGEVRIDLGARGLAVGGEAVPLTPTEYAICEYLARHPGQVMSRAQIREAVLGWESDADDAAISMQVSRARRKLSEAGADPIATVWGMGYKWQL